MTGTRLAIRRCRSSASAKAAVPGGASRGPTTSTAPAARSLLGASGGVAADDDGRGAVSHDPLDRVEATGSQVEVDEDRAGPGLDGQLLGGLGVTCHAGDHEAGCREESLQLTGPA